jgi:hypothetical protein
MSLFQENIKNCIEEITRNNLPGNMSCQRDFGGLRVFTPTEDVNKDMVVADVRGFYDSFSNFFDILDLSGKDNTDNANAFIYSEKLRLSPSVMFKWKIGNRYTFRMYGLARDGGLTTIEKAEIANVIKSMLSAFVA